MKRTFADYRSDERWEADVCIVGGGAGGCAAATALAEAGLDVLVLEEGRHWVPKDFKSDTVWAYRNLYIDRATRGTVGNAVIPLPGGRGFGGSTLINSAICFRTPKPVLDRWVSEDGCEHFAHDLMTPKLDRVWQTLGVTVNPPEIQRMNNLVFKRGCDRLGFPGHFMARSAPGCVGCGVCQLGCPSGGKLSADRSFLPIALGTGHCRANADCRVEAVETLNGAVVAVSGSLLDPTTDTPAGTFRVQARAFILSAGAIATPRFLIRNGLCDDTVCGRNLTVHPTQGVCARFEEEIVPWSGVTQGFYVDRWEDGYLLQTFATTPDQTYLTLPMSMGESLVDAMAHARFLGQAGPLVHDEDSNGAVGMSTVTYTLGDNDRRKLLKGVRACSDVFFAAGAIAFYPGVVGAKKMLPGEDASKVISDDTPARRLMLYASHPMGTCRMGRDPAAAVVDAEGRVFGWKNLYVADTSVFPTSLGVNPQVTTMAVGLTIGERVAAAVD